MKQKFGRRGILEATRPGLGEAKEGCNENERGCGVVCDDMGPY